MSITDFEQEPVDQVQGFCSTHNVYFYHGSGCYACSDDAGDRAIQDKLDERGRGDGI